jgi:hypothetical protein
MNAHRLLKSLLPGLLPLVIFVAAKAIFGQTVGLAVGLAVGIAEFVYLFVKQKKADPSTTRAPTGSPGPSPPRVPLPHPRSRGISAATRRSADRPESPSAKPPCCRPSYCRGPSHRSYARLESCAQPAGRGPKVRVILSRSHGSLGQGPRPADSVFPQTGGYGGGEIVEPDCRENLTWWRRASSHTSGCGRGAWQSCATPFSRSPISWPYRFECRSIVAALPHANERAPGVGSLG